MMAVLIYGFRIRTITCIYCGLESIDDNFFPNTTLTKATISLKEANTMAWRIKKALPLYFLPQSL